MIEKRENNIVYIGYFSASNDEITRNTSPAAVSKMTYISKTIVKTGKNVTIISPALPVDSKVRAKKESFLSISPGIDLLQAPVFPARNIIEKILRRLKINHWLFKSLKSNINHGDTVVVYHSLALIHALKKLRLSRKIRLILEVEEIYTDLSGYKKYVRKKEIKFLKSADSYIFSNDILQDLLEIKAKAIAICYGAYERSKVSPVRNSSEKINLVYAGTFQEEKGIFEVLKSSMLLSSRYVLHVLGFGNEVEISKVKNEIMTLNLTNFCKIEYHGRLLGNDLYAFLQTCDIGLCPSNLQSEYNQSSFQSKILTYLSNNLEVVGARIPSLERSAIKNQIHFYDGSADDMAFVIQKIEIKSKVESINILDELDLKFQKVIDDLLM